MTRSVATSWVWCAALVGCSWANVDESTTDVLQEPPHIDQRALVPGEQRLKHVRRLTSTGRNERPVLSMAGTEVFFLSARDGASCLRPHVMDVDGRNARHVGVGAGSSDSGQLMPGATRMIYTSTHATQPRCDAPPSMREAFELRGAHRLYIAGIDGARPVQLIDQDGHQGSAQLSTAGDRLVFTSLVDGEPELFIASGSGQQVRRLTQAPGFELEASLRPDGGAVVFSSHDLSDADALRAYEAMRPARIFHMNRREIFVVGAEGGEPRRLTQDGALASGPRFHPDGERIIFASDRDDPLGKRSSLYIMRQDGSHMERVTFDDAHEDLTPMFSADGKRLIFASTREGGGPDIYIADWVERLLPPEFKLRGPAELDPQTWSGRVERLSKLRGEAAREYISEQHRMIGLQPHAGSPLTHRAPNASEATVNLLVRLPATVEAPEAPIVIATRYALTPPAAPDPSMPPELAASASRVDGAFFAPGEAASVATMLELAEALSVSAGRRRDIIFVTADDAAALDELIEAAGLKPWQLIEVELVARQQSEGLRLDLRRAPASLRAAQMAQVGLGVDLRLSGPSRTEAPAPPAQALSKLGGAVNAEGGVMVAAFLWRWLPSL